MGINVNMSKARIIHLAEIKRVCEAQLVIKDTAYMRALAMGDIEAQTKIAALMQILRDLPGTLDLTDVDSPEELIARWPDILPAR